MFFQKDKSNLSQDIQTLSDDKRFNMWEKLGCTSTKRRQIAEESSINLDLYGEDNLSKRKANSLVININN